MRSLCQDVREATKISTWPQGERSNMLKVTRRLREHMLDFHKTLHKHAQFFCQHENEHCVSKRHQSSANTAPATKNDIQNHLHFDQRLPTSESAMPATPMKKCPMSRTCHAKRRFRPQDVAKVPRLPHEMDM